jgi:hypothetical protein
MAVMHYNDTHGTLLTEFNVLYDYKPKLKIKIGMARFTSVYQVSNSSYINTSGLHISNDLFKNSGIGINLGVQRQL